MPVAQVALTIGEIIAGAASAYSLYEKLKAAALAMGMTEDEWKKSVETEGKRLDQFYIDAVSELNKEWKK